MSDPEKEDQSLWEQQSGENAKAYAAFCSYRDMDPFDRSVKTACIKTTGKASNLKYWYEWSRINAWVERAHAFDAYVDRKKRAAALKKIEEMNERHAGAAMQVIGKALQRLIGERNERGEIVGKLRLEDISASDVIKYLSEGAKLERVARGEPETISAVNQNVSIKPSEDRLSDLFAALDARVRAGGPVSGSEDHETGTRGSGVGLEDERSTGADPSGE
jgi:hypothetical protein